MKPLTRQQREALLRIYRRTELYQRIPHPGEDITRQPLEHDQQEMGQEPATYRQFRRTVQRECYGQGIMVHWCAMWLGIESDGYVHS
ncbi:MAG: hypothetical protein OER87_07490 [Gammaproteobacteria bacterium]|nr:hypothetical protein [Gammaproteobacteria bacterium]